MTDVWFAVGLTVFAGLATSVGSIIAFFTSRTNYRFLSVSTGFSAGVMLYASFVEIFYKGAEALVTVYGNYWGHWINAASFFSGMFLIGIIDNLIPSTENPHEIHTEKEFEPLHGASVSLEDSKQTILINAAGHNHVDHHKKLMRMGLFTALAISIHNFPEGLATFFAALYDPGLGIAIAVAIAMHNIPEGISVSVPIFYATGNRKKAFIYSLLSGLSEPVGAGIAYLILNFTLSGGNGIPPQILGIVFGGIAGIMVYISLDELLPTSQAYGKGHDSVLGLIGGMGMMALSLLLMK